jgi:hypothetical protein
MRVPAALDVALSSGRAVVQARQDPSSGAMLLLRQKTGRRVMVLWQFVSFTVLIGALVVYASVIARRLGRANARLSRIEEALLVTSRPGGFADPRAAESESEVSNNEGRAGYLTIRDLKARSEQPRARATHSSARNSAAVPESRDALKTTRGPKPNLPRGATPEGELVAMRAESREALRTRSEQASPHGTRPLNVDSVPTSVDSPAPVETSGETLSLLTVQAVRDDSGGTSLESRDAPVAIGEQLSWPIMRPEGGEPPSVPTMQVAVSDDSEATSLESHAPVETSGELSSSLGIDPANGISVAKTSESGDALDTGDGPQSPPSHCPPSEDPIAKKNRDALLYMSIQRRRRRAHPGY